jgi:cell division protein FtsB
MMDLRMEDQDSAPDELEQAQAEIEYLKSRQRTLEARIRELLTLMNNDIATLRVVLTETRAMIMSDARCALPAEN